MDREDSYLSDEEWAVYLSLVEAHEVLAKTVFSGARVFGNEYLSVTNNILEFLNRMTDLEDKRRSDEVS